VASAAAERTPILYVDHRGVLNVAMLNWFFATQVKRYDLRPRLGEVRASTLVLIARHDWICAPAHSETLVRGIPGARQVMFEESGHRVIKEENARFVRVVTEFIHETT
jgi:pimeloyl-ACP methyl ester carboxylesterase